MPLLTILYAGAEKCSDELFRMIWSADNQLPALMWLNLHMDISLGLPAVTLAKLNPDILANTNILNLLPLTLRRIIVAERTMMFSSGRYWHCMHYAWGISVNCYNYYVYLLRSLPSATLLTVIILVVSSQFCDGHDTQQLCAAFTLVGISRQMLSDSVIYVERNITLFLRRTWSLFPDSSLPPDVATALRFVTLAGLDYFPDTSYTPDIAITHEFFCQDLDYTLLVEFVERPSSR